MATKTDTYTVRQTATALGLSQKRVRQLLLEGKLKQHGKNPITIKQLDVLALRDLRQEQGKSVTPKTLPDNTGEILRALSDTFQKQLEIITDSNRQNQENLMSQINELRQENQALRARKWYWR
jgi:hypothetical protein